MKEFLAFIRSHLAADSAHASCSFSYLIASDSSFALLISIMSVSFCISSVSLLSASHSFAYGTGSLKEKREKRGEN